MDQIRVLVIMLWSGVMHVWSCITATCRNPSEMDTLNKPPPPNNTTGETHCVVGLAAVGVNVYHNPIP